MCELFEIPNWVLWLGGYSLAVFAIIKAKVNTADWKSED